jgi:hypothetical protein
MTLDWLVGEKACVPHTVTNTAIAMLVATGLLKRKSA